MDRAVKASRSGPLHAFRINDPPAFLTESLALSMALEALDSDGLNSKEWAAQEDDRSKAPDGTPDRYLVRNTLNPNHGTILFVRHDKALVRYVRVELHGDVIECQVWRPK